MRLRNVSALSLALFLVCCLILTCPVQGAAAPETRLIVDQAGREVVIPATVNRIITTWQPATCMVFTVGGQSKLVAADCASLQSDFLTQVHPPIAGLPKIGCKSRGLNVEQMIACNPDVVILSEGKDSAHIIDQLASMGIPALILVPEDLEKMKEAEFILGDLLGCEDQAGRLMSYYDEKLAMLNRNLKDVPSENRPRVYLAGAHGMLSTCSKNMYQHFIIEQAGGINVAEELEGHWNRISAEQLVKWNPDVIVSVAYSPSATPDEIKSSPQLTSVNAVLDEQVYSFPSNLEPWDYPEPRSILGMIWLAKILHPDVFANLDVLEEANAFHKGFFGKTFTELGGELDLPAEKTSQEF